MMTNENWKQLYDRMFDLKSRNAAEESAENYSCESDVADSEEANAIQDYEILQEPEEDADSPKTAEEFQVGTLQSIQEQIGGIHESIVRQSETLREMSERIRVIEDDYFKEITLKPILHDLILLYDGVTRAKRSKDSGLRKKSKEFDVIGLLQGFERELLNILARHDVSLIRDTTQELDPKKQKVVGVKESGILKGRIFLSEVRPGFYWNKNVLRYQEVIVYRPKTKEENYADRNEKHNSNGH